MKTLSIFLIVVILIAGMVVCINHLPPPHNPETRDWHDLDSVRYHLDKGLILMNNIGATTAGYKRLANGTAHEGKGWAPIGTRDNPFTGSDVGDARDHNGLPLRRRPDDDHGRSSADL